MSARFGIMAAIVAIMLVGAGNLHVCMGVEDSQPPVGEDQESSDLRKNQANDPAKTEARPAQEETSTPDIKRSEAYNDAVQILAILKKWKFDPIRSPSPSGTVTLIDENGVETTLEKTPKELERDRDIEKLDALHAKMISWKSKDEIPAPKEDLDAISNIIKGGNRTISVKFIEKDLAVVTTRSKTESLLSGDCYYLFKFKNVWEIIGTSEYAISN